MFLTLFEYHVSNIWKIIATFSRKYEGKNNLAGVNKGRFCYNSEIDTLISKRWSVENKAKLSELETQNTPSVVLFIYNFQLREFEWKDGRPCFFPRGRGWIKGLNTTNWIIRWRHIKHYYHWYICLYLWRYWFSCCHVFRVVFFFVPIPNQCVLRIIGFICCTSPSKLTELFCIGMIPNLSLPCRSDVSTKWDTFRHLAVGKSRLSTQAQQQNILICIPEFPWW